jgi:hypothetical protein
MKIKLLILFTILPFLLSAQYQIKYNVKNCKDSIIYFKGCVFDDNNFIPKDTIKSYQKNLKSTSLKPIVGGIYYLQFPKSKLKIYFTLANRDSLTFSFSGDKPLENIKCSNKSNQLFFAYQRLEEKFSTVDSIYKQLQTSRKFSISQREVFYKEKRDSLYNFRSKALKILKPSDILAEHFKTLNTLDEYVPSKIDYESRKKFLDKFNLNEPNLLFTTSFKPILTEYLSSFPQSADSITKGMDEVLAKVDCKSKAYPFVFDFFTKLMRNRNILNNTDGYVYLIEKHLKNGKCKLADAKKAKEYLDQYSKIAALTKKDTCFNIVLNDTLNAPQDLHLFARKFDYTVVMFYDPDCDHCQVEVPKMDYEISRIEKILKIKIGKYAVCNAPGISKKKWSDFILKYQLKTNYVHVSIPANSKIQEHFDAYTNPVFHLINKNMIFESQKISSVSLPKFFATQH